MLRSLPATCLAVALALTLSTPAGAQPHSDSTLQGHITFSPSRLRLAPEDEVRIDVIIDLGTGQVYPDCEPPRPLGLGGYQVTFAFDPASLQFLGGAACPGTPPDFSTPTFTQTARVNQRGGGTLISASLVDSPSRACYASLRFRALARPAGVTKVRFGRIPTFAVTSLSSGFSCWNALFSIASNDGDVELQVGASASDPPAGDLNLDRGVDVLDAVTLASNLVGNTKIGAAPFLSGPSAADLNADRTLDVLDMVVLLGNIAHGPGAASR